MDGGGVRVGIGKGKEREKRVSPAAVCLHRWRRGRGREGKGGGEGDPHLLLFVSMDGGSVGVWRIMERGKVEEKEVLPAAVCFHGWRGRGWEGKMERGKDGGKGGLPCCRLFLWMEGVGVGRGKWYEKEREKGSHLLPFASMDGEEVVVEMGKLKG
jgi:hypothetical protein